ncbi:MAG: formylglycine-generating enzyme family protein [Acidobacteria bacterium]|nr:formylglycine-generating enzyme family protein [Acidobacteriota bacterium]
MTSTLKSCSSSLLKSLAFSITLILTCNYITFAQAAPRISASKSSSATEIFIRPKVDLTKKIAARNLSVVPPLAVIKEKPPLKIEMPEMVQLTGGEFQMGLKDSKSDNGPAHLTIVPSFEISKYPITNKQFAQFVTETKYRTKAEENPTEFENKNKISWKSFAGPGRDNYPVIWISYEDAQAYCFWLSSVVKNAPIKEKIKIEDEDGEESAPVYVEKIHPYRLPTEAEWEYAARGGLKEGLFPWDKIDKEKINYNVNNNRESTIQAAKLFIKAVGYQPANNFGVQDLVGNVAQWCYDWYDPNFYEYSPNPPQKAYGPEKGDERVIRGGSWLEDLESCQVTSRQSASQSTRTAQVSFRIVRVIAPAQEKTASKTSKPPISKQAIFCNINYPFAPTYHTNANIASAILIERRRYFLTSEETR